MSDLPPGFSVTGEVRPLPMDAKAQTLESKQTGAMSAGLSNMDSLSSTAMELYSNPALKMIFGKQGYRHNIRGGDAANAAALMDTLKNQIALASMSQARAGSAVGATGFGNLTEKELELLQNSYAPLQTSQSPEQGKDNLRRIISVVNGPTDPNGNKLGPGLRDNILAANGMSPGQDLGYARPALSAPAIASGDDPRLVALQATVGARRAPAPPAVANSSLIDDARAAILQGADRSKVISRLMAYGVNPKGL